VPVPRKRADTIRLHKKGVAVKKHFLAVTLAVSLLLTGCSSLLEREYADIAPHNTAPTEEGDPSIRRADSYQELVNILIYLVDAGTEHETIRLYMDSDKVEADLAAACLEVTREDPLGAYAVDFIRYDISRVVAYSQADVEIAYRRSREQVDSIVRATGVTAIRGELESALSSFAPSRTLRVSYFDGDEELIRALARQAYYNVPAAALGMPELEIYLYPDSGRQRIIEVLAAYPLEPARLEQRREALARTLRPGSVVAFTGDLGAGKTAFVRGLARGLGIGDRVTSPTFTIVNEYEGGRLPLFHFDWYRLEDGEELFEIGWEDYLSRGGVCAVEWSENAPEVLEDPIRVDIRPEGECRVISVEGIQLEDVYL